LRRQAVALRLEGATIAETREAVGLSAPTILAAVRAWRAGGWDAVDVGRRGRPRLLPADETGARAEPATDAAVALERAARLGPTTAQPCWDIERVVDWLAANGTPASRSTVVTRLADWGLAPPSRHRRLHRAAGAHYARFARRARRAGKTVLWLGDRPLPSGAVQLFAHDPRARGRWCITAGAPTSADWTRFLDGLRQATAGDLAVVLPGVHLVRDPTISSWLAAHEVEYRVVGEPRDAPPLSGRDETAAGITGMSRATSEIDVPRPVPERNTPRATLDADAPPLSGGTPCRAASAVTPHSIPDDQPRRAKDTTVTIEQTAQNDPDMGSSAATPAATRASLTHLERLEAESIHIMREVVAEADNPVMLYSIGKDSAVMLHLARKAFFPAPPPFPLLHVDTTWKFRAMYEFRDRIAKEYGLELLKHVNPEGLAQGVNPFTHGSALHTDIMKTQSLKQALDLHRFDIAFGGARRDEEKSRAKERVFSFRTAQHRWEPKSQRPELWNLYNARKRPGESIRVFPISNWTELDVWQYIHRESIPIVPLYLAAERPVVTRDGTLIMVDDERMPLHEGEVPEMRKVRFRTLGCYPLSGAVESDADTLTDVIREMLLTRTSERQGRMIDHDSAASMEKKKQEGYF